MEKICAVVLLFCLAGCGQPNYSNSGNAMADTANNSLDLSIPLDVAVLNTNPQRFSVKGKYLAIDSASTGIANLRFNSMSDTSRQVMRGSGFSQDFIDLYFDYVAQPGKFLHIIYGDSPDIIAAGLAVSADAPISPQIYIESFIGAAPAIFVIVPMAQNTNGIKILGGIVGVVN